MNKLNILVVDDEPGIRSGVKRILRDFTVDYPFMDEQITFEITEAATGEEAIELIDNTPVDIALLDNKLPGIQGIEVLEYISKKQYDILVMMITSHASLDVAVKATRDGAYDFVPKPFTPQELKSSIENITKHLFLKRMTRKLNKEGKSIRFQFLSVLSHELKAPLNAIEGYLEMIRDRQMGMNIEDYDAIIDRSLERVKGMRNMIMDLLDLTQIESGKKKRELQPLNLVPIALAAVDTMRPYAIQKEVKVNIISQGPIEVTADADEMEIIFNNLISNAVKYNKRGGTVDCYLAVENGLMTISVNDTGIGIAENDMANIFNEFVRIKNEKTKNISGSGLGLSIVKRLTEMYGGRVSIFSEPDKGTRVLVEMPQTPAKETES